jgi:NAD(P)-dependent dehydrogenase (short-subunit alcohol dehydrogenase family)
MSLTTLTDGRFIDVATGEPPTKISLQTTHHLSNVTYSTVDVGLMIKSNPNLVSRLLQSAFDFLRVGKLRRLTPPKIFNFSQISAAFQGVLENRTDKFVLKASEHDIVPVVPRDAHPFVLNPKATYLLVGGLGGLGRSLAHLLITHGAKNVVFISRSGAVSEAQRSFLSSLAGQEINTRVYKCDISSAAELSAALKACAEEMPPILGAIQGAAVIKDAIFENMSFEDWVSATRPKIQGSWNLHTLLPRDLDFFVLLSSSAGVIGARGQANYAAGNAFQDALAHHRRYRNLKAVSLDLGPILGVGMVAEDEATLDILRKSGFLGVRERDFHILVEAAMSGYTIDGHVTPPQVIVGTVTGGLILQNGVEDPYWHASPLFSIMRGVDLPPSSMTSSTSERASMQELLTSSTSLFEATSVVTEGLATLLAKSMNMQPADLDTGKPANAYGVDSLVAVGTRNWIFRETGVDVSVFEILSENSVCQLAERITRHCKFVGAELKGEAPET